MAASYPQFAGLPYLGELQSKFKNEDLVICDDDYLFNGKPFNNRWFYTESTVVKSNLVIYNDLQVARDSFFQILYTMFTALKRLKISRITFAQLKKFVCLASLEHLEIDTFLEDEKKFSKVVKRPIRLPALKRLHLNVFAQDLVGKIPFSTKALQAVHFGKRLF